MAKKGLVFITKSTFSAASTVSVDNCFSATYTHYLIRRNLSGTVAGNRLDIRMRVSGADDTGANYRYQTLEGNGTTVSGARFTAQTATPALGFTETTSMGFQEAYVSNPFDAARTTVWLDDPNTQTGSLNCVSIVGEHDLATSYTGFTVVIAQSLGASIGTITGSISVFGLVTA